MVLRHHDVPTRLLDWSLSPYVAAYFSVCDHDDEDGEIWSFDERLYEIKGGEQWTTFPETTIDGSGHPSKFDSNLTAAFSITEPSDWFVCHFYPVAFPDRKLKMVRTVLLRVSIEIMQERSQTYSKMLPTVICTS